MLLDYSQYVENNGTISDKLPTLLHPWPSNAHFSSNSNLFYDKRGVCPFCKKSISKIYTNSSSDNPFPDAMDIWTRDESVWLCDQCNWWEHEFISHLKAEDIKSDEIKIHSAILKKFDIDSKEAPIMTLREYLRINPNKIYDIHHKKMEELVASVFKDHYDCEVHLVGKSHDDGVDILIVESDSPIIVQVKRRTTQGKTEAVSGIRDLLGATLLQGSKKSIFVTTAGKFSKSAIASKEKALTKSIVDSFGLIDYHKFISLLELNKKNEKKYWQSVLQI